MGRPGADAARPAARSPGGGHAAAQAGPASRESALWRPRQGTCTWQTPGGHRRPGPPLATTLRCALQARGLVCKLHPREPPGDTQAHSSRDAARGQLAVPGPGGRREMLPATPSDWPARTWRGVSRRCGPERQRGSSGPCVQQTDEGQARLRLTVAVTVGSLQQTHVGLRAGTPSTVSQ